jgi:hypothetical protein
VIYIYIYDATIIPLRKQISSIYLLIVEFPSDRAVSSRLYARGWLLPPLWHKLCPLLAMEA